MARGLEYSKERYPAAEAFQIHATGRKSYEIESGIFVLPALELLSDLV